MYIHCMQLKFGCLNIQIAISEILNQNSYSSHDLKVSSQVCTLNNILFTDVGRGKWGVVCVCVGGGGVGR